MQIFVNLLAVSLLFIRAMFLFGIVVTPLLFRTLDRLGWLVRSDPKSDPAAWLLGLLLGLALIMLCLLLAVPGSRSLWPVVTLACVGVSLLLSLVVTMVERIR